MHRGDYCKRISKGKHTDCRKIMLESDKELIVVNCLDYHPSNDDNNIEQLFLKWKQLAESGHSDYTVYVIEKRMKQSNPPDCHSCSCMWPCSYARRKNNV